jgi:tricorn protease
MLKVFYSLMALIAFLSVQYSHAQQETKLMRYPSYGGDKVVFSYAGDLWKVPEMGGMATRLTSDVGIEIFPRYSKDGTQIAFSGEYDGNRDVYLMPEVGGYPKRLTYSMDIGPLPERMGPDKIIMHWKAEDDILFRNRGNWWHAWTGKLWLQNTDGSMAEQVPVPHGGFAYLSPDGKKMAYNRIFREYRTWKRYRGGQADDIWVYDFDTKKLENITNNPAQDIIPMWSDNGKIYFLSDRDKRMNLFCYDIKSKITKKVTDFKEYDVKFPSLNMGKVAFSNGGEIYLLDTRTDKYDKVPVTIVSDFSAQRVEYIDASKNIQGSTISPKGDFALFAARGDLFIVPNGKGMTKNLTKSPGAHDRNPAWSPDGEYIAYISDESGEDEIYVIKPDGTGKRKLTDNSDTYRFSAIWSPDSKKILTSDKKFRLQTIDVASGSVKDIAKTEMREIRDVAWSPDSRWIAFIDYNPQMMGIIMVHDTQSGQTRAVTDGFYSATDVVFTPGGNYMLFKSERTFNPKVSSIEWNVSYSDMQNVFAIALQNDTPNLFGYEGYEVRIPGKEEKKEDKDKEVTVEIDFDGIDRRVFDFPTPAGNYYGLKPTKDHKLYYSRYQSGDRPATYVYDIESREEKKVGDFSRWEVSADGSKIMIMEKGSYYIESLSPSVSPKNKIDVSNMDMLLDRKQEWRQIYDETWRQMKYFFYDPNMHGVDWEAEKERYAALLPYVNHRSDLTYIMGEMIGELNVGHAYVGGGDMPKIDEVGVGLLGADFSFDGGAYKIDKIYLGRNWDKSTYSPLDQVGNQIKEGDYLVSINGYKLDRLMTPQKALVGQVDNWVELGVAGSPNGTERKVYVKTIKTEKGLRYLDWVEANRQYVSDKTDGRVGYIHIPDMGVNNGLTEFFEYWLPQLNKEGLVIDDRYNGGGNVSPMITQRLIRDLTIVKVKRNQQTVTPSPGGVFVGPLALLINELSASDGDLFPYRFKANNLGPIIGKRSWGGVIGIYGPLPMVDGGYVYKPESANFGANGEWILEGVGMKPDIVVDNHPDRLLRGIDDQIDAAIKSVTDRIKEGDYRKIPAVPPFPDKR